MIAKENILRDCIVPSLHQTKQKTSCVYLERLLRAKTLKFEVILESHLLKGGKLMEMSDAIILLLRMKN